MPRAASTAAPNPSCCQTCAPHRRATSHCPARRLRCPSPGPLRPPRELRPAPRPSSPIRRPIPRRMRWRWGKGLPRWGTCIHPLRHTPRSTPRRHLGQFHRYTTDHSQSRGHPAPPPPRLHNHRRHTCPLLGQAGTHPGHPHSVLKLKPYPHYMHPDVFFSITSRASPLLHSSRSPPTTLAPGSEPAIHLLAALVSYAIYLWSACTRCTSFATATLRPPPRRSRLSFGAPSPSHLPPRQRPLRRARISLLRSRHHETHTHAAYSSLTFPSIHLAHNDGHRYAPGDANASAFSARFPPSSKTARLRISAL